MNFEYVISEIKNNFNSFSILLDELKHKHKIYIWGTGVAGNMIFHALVNLGISIVGFIDGNNEKENMVFNGKDVFSYNTISKDSFVIIAANFTYKIHNRLEQTGISYTYIDPAYISTYYEKKPFDVLNCYLENREKIRKIFGLLRDDMSKKVLGNILIHRAIHRIELIMDIYNPNQYMGNDVVDRVSGGFVDCGAYNGDTLNSFMSYVDGDYSYYAFEADEENFKDLVRFCEKKNLKNVELHNLGVWDKEDVLYFNNDLNSINGNEVGKIASEGNAKIKVSYLDKVLSNKKIAYIKMDIEGAEINALNGAKNIIRQQKPVLGISVYHELEHLWNIPLMIYELNETYCVYLRHHMWNTSDTVCYAINEGEERF